MGDVAEILGIEVKKETSGLPLPGQGSLKRKAPPVKHHGPKGRNKRRKKGLSREVRALTEGMTSLKPEPKKMLSFKEKRTVEKHRAVNWELRPFRNTARTDDAVYQHWVKASSPHTDYVYANLNKPLELLLYSNADYEQYLQSSIWTREETDELYKLAQKFDLRWMVIKDRWDSQTKSMEELKNRYYTTQHKLAELQTFRNDTAMVADTEEGTAAASSISRFKIVSVPKHSYKIEKDVRRKKQLDLLYHRTTEQLEEEENLMQRYSSINLYLKKHKEEAGKLLKLGTSLLKLADSQGAVTSAPANTAPPTSQAVAQKASEVRRSKTIKTMMDAAGVAQGGKYTVQLNNALADLGVAKPNKPTARVGAQFASLRDSLLVLFELQKLNAEVLYIDGSLQRQKTLLQQKLHEKNGSKM